MKVRTRDGLQSNESKRKGTGNSQAHDSPASLDDARVAEGTAGIPDQVPHAVHAVVGERQSHDRLQKNLGGNGERTEGGGNRGRLQVPAEQGRSEVCSRPQVQGAGEGDARDAVQRTADPSDLGLVDGQVRGDGTVQALLGQDLGRVFGIGGRGGLSVSRGSVIVMT